MKYSLSKENRQTNLQTFKRKKSNFCFKQKNIQGILTQSLFPSKKNSLKNPPINLPLPTNNLYETFTSPFQNDYIFPSTQSSFKPRLGRPQTSKGSRIRNDEHLTKTRQQHRKQNQQFINFTSINPNFMHTYSSKQLQKQNNFKYFDQIEDFNQINSNPKSIRIIVTKNDNYHREKQLLNHRLQTNLPDDFLSLFAE